jgi:predicted CXXCH cytochrome family protein
MSRAKKRQRINIAITSGLAVWAIAVISCTTVTRVVVAPPEVAGATYVGSDECTMCHEQLTTKFAGSTHSKLHVEGGNAGAIGCEACHGPGSVHTQAGGGLFNIVNPGRNPETCFNCHLEKKGEFSLANSHPVMSGDMSCSDCHNPHEGLATKGGGLQLASLNDTCVTCHQAQRGPFVFEHEAARDGCVVCHSPHGSVNAKMLKARNATLCLQCHFQQQTVSGQILIGGRNHAPFMSRGTCWSGGCHEAVHGSHVSSSLRF